VILIPTYPADVAEGSGDDSGDEGERPTKNDDHDEDEDDAGTVNSLVGRPRSSRIQNPEYTFHFSFRSSMSVGRPQNHRSSSHHPRKPSALMRKKMQSSRRSSQNSSQMFQRSRARSTGAPHRHCGNLLSCHRECVNDMKKAMAPRRAWTLT
jgi:hypothetical protein